VVNSAVAIILMVSVSFVFPHRVIFVFRDDFRHSLGRWEWRGTGWWCLASCGSRLYPLKLGCSVPWCLRLPLGPQRPPIPSWKQGSLQWIQCFVYVLQIYSTLYTEETRVLSGLLNCDITQITCMTNSAGFWLRLCSFWLMSSVTQAQRLCNSASDALQLWLRALWVLRAEEERSACRVL